jgi:hypothetical protein
MVVCKIRHPCRNACGILDALHDRHTMTDKPSHPGFSLTTLLLWTAFAGLGCLAVKYPSVWVMHLINMTLVFLFAYATGAAFVCGGSRRLFWVVFCSSLLLVLLIGQPAEWRSVGQISAWMHPDVDEPSSFGGTRSIQYYNCTTVIGRLITPVLSTIAAYIIPWLVQRTQKLS